MGWSSCFRAIDGLPRQHWEPPILVLQTPPIPLAPPLTPCHFQRIRTLLNRLLKYIIWFWWNFTLLNFKTSLSIKEGKYTLYWIKRAKNRIMFPFTWEMKKKHSYRQFSHLSALLMTVSTLPFRILALTQSLHLCYLKTHSENNVLGQEFWEY